MFDTMTLAKATGAVCAAMLVYLFGAWAADELYHVGDKSYGDEVAQSDVIEVAGAEVAEEVVVEEGPSFEVVFASADVAAGGKEYGKCKACHKIDGSDGTGPHLNGVVNRGKGAVGGYDYSDALLALTSEVWSAENLNGFLQNPKGYMPGTKMIFAGLRDVEDRANVIAYLASVN